MPKAVWIGLGDGERRIGVAVSDPRGITAQPPSYIARSGGAADVQKILAIAEEVGAIGFVLGLPLRTDGSHGPEAQKVQELADALRAETARPIEWVDERFTPVLAERSRREQGGKGAARRAGG